MKTKKAVRMARADDGEWEPTHVSSSRPRLPSPNLKEEADEEDGDLGKTNPTIQAYLFPQYCEFQIFFTCVATN